VPFQIQDDVEEEKAQQEEDDLNEIFGDMESSDSFSSDSEDEKFDVKEFDASMPLSFNS
jgi:hypothetical protein